MAITKIRIEEFLALAATHPVLDVRSPSEYSHAHIPGAHSLPLFTDEERKVVGTAYKQQGRQTAIKAGLDYFGPKMRKMVEDTEVILKGNAAGKTNQPVSPNPKFLIPNPPSPIPNPQSLIPNPQSPIPNPQSLIPNSQSLIPNPPIPNSQSPSIILLHCWRGGMRSAGVAWLLDLYGFKVYTLAGGYKAFRNWCLHQFGIQYPFRIIGGYTGSGKTMVLRELAKTGRATLDLEAIACHKGSAFGDLGEPKQDTQEMFENHLAMALSRLVQEQAIWVEDESQRIGNLNIPDALWNTLRKCPVWFLDVPFEERLKYITAEYGKFRKDLLVGAAMRIQKRLGGLNTKNAVSHLLEDNFTEAFRILLTYYDKYYTKALHERANLSALLTTVPCPDTHPRNNSLHLLAAYNNTLAAQ